MNLVDEYLGNVSYPFDMLDTCPLTRLYWTVDKKCEVVMFPNIVAIIHFRYVLIRSCRQNNRTILCEHKDVEL